MLISKPLMIPNMFFLLYWWWLDKKHNTWFKLNFRKVFYVELSEDELMRTALFVYLFYKESLEMTAIIFFTNQNKL